ncbi:glycosyltransferase [Siminovitchia terrae]|uniref:glycosyltransferase n=1 Tax=Siminovitchia terrae TaxID=1914933 RepID=UPI0028AF2378|nr:glycosyltransferase [Siminovitchia terrae]
MDEAAIDRRLSTLKHLKKKIREEINEDRKSLMEQYGAVYESKYDFLDASIGSVKDKGAYLSYRDQVSDKHFLEEIKPLLDQIPDSNGSRFYEQIKANIGIICDEFLFHSFQGVANFIYIDRDRYKEIREDLDVLLVVSAWKGIDSKWKGLGNPNIRKHREDLEKVIDYFRDRGTKIVFYSKEDPVNYHVFLGIAQKCDYIFTTAEEKIECYKANCGNENVFLLGFGVNPTYHHPIGMRKFPKRKEVLFAGSWYEKYPDRQEETRVLFDGVLEAGKGLKIIDRNFELKLEQFFFPEEYLQYVSPSIQHQYLQKLYKLFDWTINLNSVKYSDTMFANRIYEVQALGNNLLSNYSIGVNNQFPNVFTIHNEKEIQSIFESFTEEEVYQHQVWGIRRVMSKETSYHRIEEMLEKIGFKTGTKNRKATVIVKEKTQAVCSAFNKQTYPYKKLFAENEVNEEALKEYDIVAFFDPQKEYGEFYLEDMINGFKYTNCDYITKDAYYDGHQLVEGIEHDYVNQMKDKYRTVFWKDAFPLSALLKMEGPVHIENGYSIDRFEFNSKKIEKAVQPKEYKLSVIVPVYNNGDHLLNKCFLSLKRSTLFDDMEIVMVDDGSTDGYTPGIVKRIANEYANVKTFFFEEGGSGSASRPRNKGAELATANYIAYLDPDNEAIHDGYDHLYKEVQGGRYDMAVGNMVRLAHDEMLFDYYQTAIQYNGSSVISENVHHYLSSSQFKAMSIQALIVRKEVIVNNGLEMVVGAAGQDTLFFHELLLHARRTKVINLPIHIYYAAVSGSTVNTVTKRFFEKYYLLENARKKFLKKHGLLEEYMEKRFNYYFKNWYLDKLKNVREEEAFASVMVLEKIFALYQDHLVHEDEELTKFKSILIEQDYEQILNEFVEDHQKAMVS